MELLSGNVPPSLASVLVASLLVPLNLLAPPKNHDPKPMTQNDVPSNQARPDATGPHEAKGLNENSLAAGSLGASPAGTLPTGTTPGPLGRPVRPPIPEGGVSKGALEPLNGASNTAEGDQAGGQSGNKKAPVALGIVALVALLGGAGLFALNRPAPAAAPQPAIPSATDAGLSTQGQAVPASPLGAPRVPRNDSAPIQQPKPAAAQSGQNTDQQAAGGGQDTGPVIIPAAPVAPTAPVISSAAPHYQGKASTQAATGQAAAGQTIGRQTSAAATPSASQQTNDEAAPLTTPTQPDGATVDGTTAAGNDAAANPDQANPSQVTAAPSGAAQTDLAASKANQTKTNQPARGKPAPPEAPPSRASTVQGGTVQGSAMQGGTVPGGTAQTGSASAAAPATTPVRSGATPSLPEGQSPPVTELHGEVAPLPSPAGVSPGTANDASSGSAAPAQGTSSPNGTGGTSSPAEPSEQPPAQDTNQPESTPPSSP